MATSSKHTPLILENNSFPLLPLKDVVVLPFTVIPLFAGRQRSVNAITQAMGLQRYIFLVTQKNEKDEDPSMDNLYQVGTLANILQMIKMPDGTLKMLVEGIKRVKITHYTDTSEYTSVQVAELTQKRYTQNEAKAMIKLGLEHFEHYAKLHKKIPNEILETLQKTESIEHFIYILASHLELDIKERQQILENPDQIDCLEKVVALILSEIEVLDVEQKIHTRIRKQMDNNQRDYYLNEQMKSIQKELGQIDDSNELEELTKRIKAARLSREAKKKADDELKKLRRMSSQSSDSAIIRTYLENICDVPWYKTTRVNKDLNKAQVILDNDHYGLNKVKERILEYLAVQNRVSHNKANILCLVGPPGVGKTSLGQSIAKAVNRKFVRMALGGVRDEAEIRGHRRTYIGAMPGTIVQKMQKIGVKNPLFLLDEIDKIASDFRGDPASALLEVLDPEQNHTFNDHYLEVDYDLSQVMFVTTANTFNLPAPLLDRMEVINLSGYTEDEKLIIANEHLIVKQMKNNGVKNSELEIKDDALLEIIRYYTQEAGVRGLTREISTICRKVVKDILLNKTKKKYIITAQNIKDYLGVRKYRFGIAESKDQVGQVTGLAWTAIGGDLLTIEAVANKGKGKLNYTGQLGDVMQESIQAAMSVIRSRSADLNININFYKELDIHIHVPDGATPKDGPSAGAAMCVVLASILTKRTVKASVAMTGELTLRGEITPIGGLKEKLLAALRGGIRSVLIPQENDRELSEVPNNIKDKLNIIKVRWIDEVFSHVLNT